MTVSECRARLFRLGLSQAVRIPKAFELPGREVLIRKEGASLILEPVARPSLLDVLDRLQPLDEDFPAIEDPLPGSVRF